MNSELLQQLTALDAAGFLITGNEDAGQFLKRVEAVKAVYAEFEAELADRKKVKVFDLFEVDQESRITPEIAEEAAGITGKLYGFKVSHVPGFFLKRQIGWLWGGCLIGDPEVNFAVFLLRNAFRRKRRFLNYRREELLAHELCHAVHHVMDEPQLEEYFAYQTSPSPLRRYLGNCFISDRDAWGFLLPVMLLPVAELIRALWLPGFPSWIFWILAAVYPLFLLCRNHFSRRLVRIARRNLLAAGVKNPDAVLFRCLLSEIRELKAMPAGNIRQWIDDKAAESLRYQVIKQRFFCENEEPVEEGYEEK